MTNKVKREQGNCGLHAWGNHSDPARRVNHGREVRKDVVEKLIEDDRILDHPGQRPFVQTQSTGGPYSRGDTLWIHWCAEVVGTRKKGVNGQQRRKTSNYKSTRRQRTPSHWGENEAKEIKPSGRKGPKRTAKGWGESQGDKSPKRAGKNTVEVLNHVSKYPEREGRWQNFFDRDGDTSQKQGEGKGKVVGNTENGPTSTTMEERETEEKSLNTRDG